MTVQVLNGTSTDNLAHDVADKLANVGYKATGTQNASETGLTSTIVGYTASSARTDALAVAKSLDLGPASVQGVSQGGSPQGLWQHHHLHDAGDRHRRRGSRADRLTTGRATR